MPVQFRHLRAQYFDAEPARARALREYHLFEGECAGLIATETRHPARFNIPRHAHDLPSFYMVLEGSLSESDGRATAQLEPWSVVFTPSGHIHGNTFHDRGSRCFLVELSPDWTARLDQAGLTIRVPWSANEGGLGELVARLYREFRRSDSLSPLAAEGLVLEILGRLSRAASDPVGEKAPPWLAWARDLVHDRVAEQLKLWEIAEAVGVHPVHLTRSFRKRFRCTPGEYQRRLRVERAARELATTTKPLSEIAFSCGFADQAHFCRVFKTNTGWTPSGYRAAFKTI